jgi:hypothetical protein
VTLKRSSKQHSTAEHSTAKVHTCAVGTATRHTRDTRDGAASSPRLCRGLVAGLSLHGVCLAVVLGHVGVHRLHNVGADGCHKHSGQSHLQQGKQRTGERAMSSGPAESHALIGLHRKEVLIVACCM